MEREWWKSAFALSRPEDMGDNLVPNGVVGGLQRGSFSPETRLSPHCPACLGATNYVTSSDTSTSRVKCSVSRELHAESRMADVIPAYEAN